MTLAELVPAVQQLPAADKIKLIRLLAEDLDATDDFYRSQLAFEIRLKSAL